jgi:hypothetical protein
MAIAPGGQAESSVALAAQSGAVGAGIKMPVATRKRERLGTPERTGATRPSVCSSSRPRIRNSILDPELHPVHVYSPSTPFDQGLTASKYLLALQAVIDDIPHP